MAIYREKQCEAAPFGSLFFGGLASVMSVWFDQSSTTFAEMPLASTANSTSAIAANDSEYQTQPIRSAA